MTKFKPNGTHDNKPETEHNANGISDSKFATHERKYMDLIDNLRSLGVSAILDIPTIAVVGNQSAGKSSLLEAIAEVPFPRASGTCTKCPTELHLVSRGTGWEAKVQLRFKFDSTGGLLPQSRDIHFGPSINDKSQLGDLLRKAQLAILNPNAKPQVFLELDSKVLDTGKYSDDQIGFSNNAIILQIWGDVPNLTLIDLPDESHADAPRRVISIAPDGEPAFCVDQIKNLAKEYNSNEKCLILTVLAMDSDPENNTAHALVQAAVPEGKRTIGVLTKPDRVQEGDEDGWMALIRNEKQPLKHRWHVVRNPATADIQKGMSWRDARFQETTFFAGPKSFQTLSGDPKKQMGSANLTSRLSELLSELIKTSLPGIRNEISRCLAETKAWLTGLPEAPSADPNLKINELITEFTNIVCGVIDGEHISMEDESLVQELHLCFDLFKQHTRSTIPILRPFRTTDRDNAGTWTPLPFLGSDEQLLDPATSEPAPDVLDMDLDQISALIRRSRSRELPDNVPYAVKAKLMKGAMRSWPACIEECCDEVVHRLQARLAKLAAGFFEGYSCGGLDEAVRITLQSLVEERQERCGDTLRALGDWQETEPYTQNDSSLASYKQDLLGHYRGIRNDARRGKMPGIITIGGIQYVAEDGLQILAASLSQCGFDEVTVKDFDKLLKTDQYYNAIEVMAEVRAYFVIAQMRVVDNVPRTIDREFVRPIGKEMSNRLRKELGLVGPDAELRAASYLSEPRDVTADRKRLLEKVKLLGDARATLTAFFA